MSQANGNGARKAPILGQPHGLSDEEARSITEMILEAQGSTRQLTIPAAGLDAQATTQMSAEAARVVNASHGRDIPHQVNRHHLYGLGRFDEYGHGLLAKG